MLCLNFWCPVSSAAVMQSSLMGAMMLPGLPLRTMASSKNGRADGKKVMECNGQEIEQRWCGERLICQTVKSHWDACIISCDCHTSPFFRNTFLSQEKLLLSCIPRFFSIVFNVFFRFLTELQVRRLLKFTSKPRFSKPRCANSVPPAPCLKPQSALCFVWIFDALCHLLRSCNPASWVLWCFQVSR